MGGIVRNDGVHQYGLHFCGSTRNGEGHIGNTRNLFIVLGIVAIVMDIPMEGDLLATILVWYSPQQVDNGIVATTYAGADNTRGGVSNSCSGIASIAVHRHFSVNTLLDSAFGEIVTTGDVFLRPISDNCFLCWLSLYLDSKISVLDPAIVVLLVVKRHLDAYLV